jgi:two-component system, OmpR family, phosphate regulon response regulator OmpR
LKLSGHKKELGIIIGNEKAHILVVDDDERLRELLQKYLRDNGFRVTTSEDAVSTRKKIKNIIFDLIVLDRMMPGETGLELAKSLKFSQTVPILMLTAMSETENRIEGLEAGVDDYLIKPFEPRELLLRIHAILRRLPLQRDDTEPSSIRMGALIFDIKREELKSGRDIIGLTTTEARLLKILAIGIGRVFAREDLIELLNQGGGARTVDVQVNRLRHKIEEDAKAPRYLQTIRGQGYILRPDSV